RVDPVGGSRSWVFRYGAQGKRYHGLGPAHTTSLSEAREAARQCRRLMLEGRDPIQDRRARKAAAKLEAAKAITSHKPPRPTSPTFTPPGRTRKISSSGAIRCATTPSR